MELSLDIGAAIALVGTVCAICGSALAIVRIYKKVDTTWQPVVESLKAEVSKVKEGLIRTDAKIELLESYKANTDNNIIQVREEVNSMNEKLDKLTHLIIQHFTSKK